MEGALQIYPKRPTPLPRAPSRRQSPLSHICKRLHFDNPGQTLLRNALGEKFTVTPQELYPGGQDIKIRSVGRETGELTITLSLRASREENKVSISSITCHAPDNSEKVYSKPSAENRGFGIVRLATHFAKKLAEEQGITRITIMPYCIALKEHYLDSGFREAPVSDTIREHELVLRLKN